MPSTQATQICEQLIYYFYENILTAPSQLESLFHEDHKIEYLITDTERREFATHESQDITIPVQKFIKLENKYCEVLAWSFQVLADGISIEAQVQYKDVNEAITVTTADSFYLIRLPGTGSYAIKGYTCELIH